MQLSFKNLLYALVKFNIRKIHTKTRGDEHRQCIMQPFDTAFGGHLGADLNWGPRTPPPLEPPLTVCCSVQRLLVLTSGYQMYHGLTIYLLWNRTNSTKNVVTTVLLITAYNNDCWAFYDLFVNKGWHYCKTFTMSNFISQRSGSFSVTTGIL